MGYKHLSLAVFFHIPPVVDGNVMDHEKYRHKPDHIRQHQGHGEQEKKYGPEKMDHGDALG